MTVSFFAVKGALETPSKNGSKTPGNNGWRSHPSRFPGRVNLFKKQKKWRF